MTASKGVLLCVDDDPDILDWMKLILGTAGYAVHSAEGGREALAAVDRIRPQIILLDVNMPDLNGYEVCTRLQERPETSAIPVVIITALGDDRDKVKGLRAGAADYLVKPLEPRTLLAMVESQMATFHRWKEIQSSSQLPRQPLEPAARTESSAQLGPARWDVKLKASEFTRFKDHVALKAKLTGEARQALLKIASADLYPQMGVLGVSQRQVAEFMAGFLSLPFRDQFEGVEIRLGVLPVAFCQSNSVVPVTTGDGAAFVLSNPFKWEVQEAIKRAVDRNSPPTLLLTDPAGIDLLLQPRTTVSKKKVAISEIEARLQEEYSVVDEAKLAELQENATEQSAPIIQLVNGLIDAAYNRGASDIHVEPAEEEVVIRYRIDGDLQVINRLRPARLIQPMVARLKIMANLDISERRLPQDGRIKFKQHSSTGKDFDLRVATAPMNHGEKVVMRILDKQKTVLPLPDLGFSQRNLDLYRSQIKAPYGMILHVGPTGSGKSMTLYAALNEIKDPSLNVQTAEDPIEYTLPGINQLQTHKEIGLTFARALRSFLRLDPDVILVGEIRDHETAEIAIEAALTGHLLLSTLHTNDAAATVTRFVEMGIEPYMISSSLLLVCAQRLLRRLCKECKEAYEPDAVKRRMVGAPDGGKLALFRPKGCEKCHQTGYRGRVGVHEILVPDDEMRLLINTKGVSSEKIKRSAVEQGGMTTLFWDAMEKVRQGLCSLDDALSNVRQDEFDSRPKWMDKS